MTAGRPRISSHDHRRTIAVSEMDQLFIVESKQEVGPEAIRAVEVVVSPVVIHPRQCIRAILVPGMKKVERMSRFVNPRVKKLPHCSGLIVIRRGTPD